MAQADATHQVCPHQAEGGIGRQQQAGDDIAIPRVFLVLWQILEQAGYGLQTELLGRYLGRGRVVHQLDRMVKGPYASRQEQVRGRLDGENWIVDDHVRRDLGLPDAGLATLGVGVAGQMCAFGCAERGRNGNVVQVAPDLLVRSVRDHLGRVDGTAAADADDGVDVGLLADCLDRFVELGDGRVLLDAREGAGMLLGAEQLLDLVDQTGLCGE